MRNSRLIPLTLAGLLAACSAQPTRNETGDGPVAASVSPKREAGSWLVSTMTTRYDTSGLPPAMKDMAEAGKASIGKKDVGGPVCLTAAKAAEDTVNTRLQEAIRFGSEWRVERQEFKNGTVDFVATRFDPNDGDSRMAIKGTIAPEHTKLTLVTTATQPGGPGRIETEMVTENRRVGDCAPGQDEWQ